MKTIMTALSVVCAMSFAVNAADWTQYRGPNGDGVSPEKVSLSWPSGGPKSVWKVDTKNGFSSFAIANGVAFIQVNRDVNGEPREMLVALDAKTGKDIWTADAGVGKYDGSANAGTSDNKGGDGPRSSPAFNAGNVYVYNQSMVLFCFDAKTGKEVWSRDVMKDHEGRKIGWNSAASPVVDGDLVFVAGGGAGQSFLALNKKTGAVAWKCLDEKNTHATPTVATIQGVRQIIFFAQSGLVSLAVKDGAELWRFPVSYKTSSAASPVVEGDTVFCSAGYGVGGAACKIAKDGSSLKATELYRVPGDKEIANHWSTPVAKDGHLYGMFSFKAYGKGPLKCVELATGKVKWEQPGFGAGNVIIVGDKVIALSDAGEVVMVEASPSAYKELGRTKAVDGKCWSTPAFSDGMLYVRSTKQGACLNLSGK